MLFEDELTIRYQIQEMLHIEKIFDEEGIQGELDAYLPLVPYESNLKETIQIEYENEIERRAALQRLIASICRSKVSSLFMQSLTKISSARTTKRLRRRTFCDSNSGRG